MKVQDPRGIVQTFHQVKQRPRKTSSVKGFSNERLSTTSIGFYGVEKVFLSRTGAGGGMQGGGAGGASGGFAGMGFAVEDLVGARLLEPGALLLADEEVDEGAQRRTRRAEQVVRLRRYRRPQQPVAVGGAALHQVDQNAQRLQFPTKTHQARSPKIISRLRQQKILFPSTDRSKWLQGQSKQKKK